VGSGKVNGVGAPLEGLRKGFTVTIESFCLFLTAKAIGAIDQVRPTECSNQPLSATG
jgi:hypothetical protein